MHGFFLILESKKLHFFLSFENVNRFVCCGLSNSWNNQNESETTKLMLKICLCVYDDASCCVVHVKWRLNKSVISSPTSTSRFCRLMVVTLMFMWKSMLQHSSIEHDNSRFHHPMIFVINFFIQWIRNACKMPKNYWKFDRDQIDI